MQIFINNRGDVHTHYPHEDLRTPARISELMIKIYLKRQTMRYTDVLKNPNKTKCYRYEIVRKIE